MACTTILVGKHASYDGSTMIARNDDSGSGHFTPKKFVVIHPEDQKRIYRSVLSHVEVELPAERPFSIVSDYETIPFSSAFSTRVNGPSLNSSTFISAPKLPCSTFGTYCLQRSTKYS